MPQSIIYSFEHRYIPSSVWNSQYFLDDLFKYGERKVLFTAIQDIYNKPVQDAPICPYKPEDFGGFHGQLSETLYFSLLVFPAPREVTECFCAIIFFDKTTNRKAYYTFELGKDLDGSELQFFCEWTQEGKHINYASVRRTPDSHIGDLFLLRFFYLIFYNLSKNTKIPYEPKEANDNTKTLNCGICKNEIYYETKDLKEGDDILVICPKCGQIYQIKN